MQELMLHVGFPAKLRKQVWEVPTHVHGVSPKFNSRARFEVRAVCVGKERGSTQQSVDCQNLLVSRNSQTVEIKMPA